MRMQQTSQVVSALLSDFSKTGSFAKMSRWEKWRSCFFLNCVTRAPVLNFIRSWVALSFKVVSQSVSQSVRHAWHPSRSPLCAIYKGIDALYWPSIMKYQMPTPHSVLYIGTQYTASSSRNAELSQLDLIFLVLPFFISMKGSKCQNMASQILSQYRWFKVVFMSSLKSKTLPGQLLMSEVTSC